MIIGEVKSQNVNAAFAALCNMNHRLSMESKDTPVGKVYMIFDDGKMLSNTWMDIKSVYKSLNLAWLKLYKEEYSKLDFIANLPTK